MEPNHYPYKRKTPANGPEKEFVSGNITATIWQNDGKRSTYRTISLQRRYKDGQGNWKFSKSLWMEDIPHAVMVLLHASSYLVFTPHQTTLAKFTT